ncbi:MAG TPA: ATPase [Desulfobulbaceae bacterium]|nr:MAG: ATPase [Deltaproteobacteria bacterium RIFOXYD12_FULL_53_23]HCC54457.1 ATPase [Desulfobulbaceae bacterium]
MRDKIATRKLEAEVNTCLRDFPAVAILGPRQCGKSTLAKKIIGNRTDSVYLDLELPSDVQKLSEPELFLGRHAAKLICLDEIQRLPEIFPVLRGIIDANRSNSRFLILGSASQELIRQGSETLAGRIAYLELTPFLVNEIASSATQDDTLHTYWLRGGFPDSFLARSEKASLIWRENFIRTFLERDIPQLGISIPAATLRRVWQLCAHNSGQLFNASQLGASLGVSHTTMRKYIDLLAHTFMLRVLPPFETNLKKRLVKTPKLYLRDSGILHSLLRIDNLDNLFGHPALGASWETVVLENVIAAMPGWDAFFYRTAAGAEIDLVLTRGGKKIAVECKASAAPRVSRGFWQALDDLAVDAAWVITPGTDHYPIAPKVMVSSLSDFIEEITVKP